MASLVLSTENGSDDDLPTLVNVLADYDELRGQIRRVRAVPGPAEMGAAIEALSITLAPGGAATMLAAGIALWLRRRHAGRPGKLGLRLELPDGTKLHVDATGIENVEAVVAAAVKPWTDTR